MHSPYTHGLTLKTTHNFINKKLASSLLKIKMQEGFSAESIGEYCCVGRLARDMRAGMARPLRIEYPGAVYHVICRGNNRQNIFKDDRDRKRYLEKLVYYCELKEIALLSYCLLSNH